MPEMPRPPNGTNRYVVMMLALALAAIVASVALAAMGKDRLAHEMLMIFTPLGGI